MPILFADDTSLFHSHTCFNTLIQEVHIQLHKFSTWFNTNKLSLNTKKTNFIIFTRIGKKYNITEADININGSKIKHVKCTKFLGITIVIKKSTNRAGAQDVYSCEKGQKV